ncbi:Hypothetical predicted protein [Pelobates cultripes]|uniref:Uncharacterized protein n=1 Tax=Pelobates cultripes TaxID=61616 RepID=A0AAD1RPL9_PELCU|nr:Hypothetical predicted protein [Pelobates cultripes]
MAHSSQTSPATSTLAQISEDIAKITASMLTRKDKVDMVAELRAVIREEITAVRRDLTALEQRINDLEVDHLQNAQYWRQASELATGRQGNILLDIRRQVEDLDNRGRRKNIRGGRGRPPRGPYRPVHAPPRGHSPLRFRHRERATGLAGP